MIQRPLISAIFFDAAGTLFHLKEPVGETYQRIALKHRIDVSSERINDSFKLAWKQLPQPVHESGPDPDDDKLWWKRLVQITFETALNRPLEANTFDPLFDELYQHFEKAEAWQLYPETQYVLTLLSERFPLYVLSNFDRRLYSILDGLKIARHFQHIILSSETGASKPHPRIFERALSVAKTPANKCLHVGDHAEYDFAGASKAGMQCILLDRPSIDLKAVVIELGQM